MRRMLIVAALAVVTVLSVMVAPAAQAQPSGPISDQQSVSADANLGSWCGNIYGRDSGWAYHCRTWNAGPGGTYWGNWSAELHADEGRDVVLRASFDGRAINMGLVRGSSGSKSFSGRYERIKVLKFQVCESAGAGGAVKNCGGWK